MSSSSSSRTWDTCFENRYLARLSADEPVLPVGFPGGGERDPFGASALGVFLEGRGSSRLGVDYSRLNPFLDRLARFVQDKAHRAKARHEIMHGFGGLALAYLVAWERFPQLYGPSPTLGDPAGAPWKDRAEVERLALRYLRKAEESAGSARSLTFLNGTSGLDALKVAFLCAGLLPFSTSKIQDAVSRLLSAEPSSSPASDTPDELFYGRAGYLYALRFAVRYLDRSREFSLSPVAASLLQKLGDACLRVQEAIYTRGVHHTLQDHSRSPIMYQWHGKCYLGGAHGLSGILYVMLDGALPSAVLPPFDSDLPLLKRTLDFIATVRFKSGNYPSREGSRDDRLVQFCHGATAPALMYLQAHRALGDSSYLLLAAEAAEVVWQRGLLKKGVGLCHGISGSIMVFLKLHHATRDTMWMARALCFVDFIVSEQPIPTGDGADGLWCQPDQPYCLYNGAAGLLCALHELLLVLRFPDHHPSWPGFDLPSFLQE